MKILLIIIAALFASVGVALLVKEDPGYVLITVGQWTVESTVAVLIVGTIIAFCAIYVLVRLLMMLFHLPRTVARANQRRRERKSHRLLADGMGQLAEGDFKAAERKLLQSTRHSDTPVLGYLGAAQAAQQLGQSARRDNHLSDARQADENRSANVGIQQAEMLMATNQPEEAAKVLESLRRRYPRNPEVLRKSIAVDRTLKDWTGLAKLLPDIRRSKILSDTEVEGLEKEVYREVLGEKAKGDDPAELGRAWSEVPRRLRSDPDLVVDYAGYLEGHGISKEAERILRKTVSHHWHPKPVLAYGELTRGDAAEQMKVVEGWLKGRPKDPDLLLTAGRIARRNRLWGKASGFYEASIAQRPTPDAYHELGSLLEQLEEPTKASDCYRNGLQLLTGRELTTATTVLEFKPTDETPESAESASEEKVVEGGKVERAADA